MNDVVSSKESRLIEWTVDQLSGMLKKIVARRQAIENYKASHGPTDEIDPMEGPPVLHYSPMAGMVIEEVKDIVHIPPVDTALLMEEAMQDYQTIELPDEVVEQLTNFVSTVTTFYYPTERNPFHNYSHASHVLMSVIKMLQRIVSPKQAALEQNLHADPEQRMKASLSLEEVADHTFGITTDPLVQFAVYFAALM
jgi:hypothetical protein